VPRPVEIIGVVGNVQQAALDAEPTWDLYVTYPQIHADGVGLAAANMFWVVRTTAEPMTLATSLAREVRRLDPEVATSQIRPMDHYLADTVAPRRFNVLLMTAFALAALALALTGIYAVVAYSVSQRARELAIRAALGAGGVAIVRLVMRHVLGFVASGVAAGVVLAIGATRLVSTLLFGVAATDSATFVQVAGVIGVVSLLAAAVPTMRVGRLTGRALQAE
jgi:putative ABC transport system permease protein